MQPDFLLPRLLYRDALMLVIDKPAGMPVHKGSGGGENLEQYFDALRFGLPRLPALAHRLDKDTSGCLVLGRHRKALDRLGKMFANGRIEKTYWAIVDGAPPQAEGILDLPLAKQSAQSRHWRMKPAEPGEESVTAVTHYKILRQQHGQSWLELKPKTGRTHQLRVHCAALGCPIAGDRIYGTTPEPMQLHAQALSIPLYPNKDAILVSAPPPEHMKAWIEKM